MFPIVGLVTCTYEALMLLNYANWETISPADVGTFELMSNQLIVNTIYLGLYWVWFILVIAGVCKKSSKYKGLTPKPVEFEEEQVVTERERVMKGQKELEVIKVQELVKVYEGKDPNP